MHGRALSNARFSVVSLLVYHESGKVIVQEIVQFLGSDTDFKVSVFHEGDVSGLLADHHDVRVGGGTHADSGAMSEPEAAGDVVVVGNGQDAPGREYPVVGNDCGTVVQGGVFEKDVFEQFLGHDGTNQHAGLRVVEEFRVLR